MLKKARAFFAFSFQKLLVIYIEATVQAINVYFLFQFSTLANSLSIYIHLLAYTRLETRARDYLLFHSLYSHSSYSLSLCVGCSCIFFAFWKLLLVYKRSNFFCYGFCWWKMGERLRCNNLCPLSIFLFMYTPMRWPVATRNTIATASIST